MPTFEAVARAHKPAGFGRDNVGEDDCRTEAKDPTRETGNNHSNTNDRTHPHHRTARNNQYATHATSARGTVDAAAPANPRGVIMRLPRPVHLMAPVPPAGNHRLHPTYRRCHRRTSRLRRRTDSASAAARIQRLPKLTAAVAVDKIHHVGDGSPPQRVLIGDAHTEFVFATDTNINQRQ